MDFLVKNDAAPVWREIVPKTPALAAEMGKELFIPLSAFDSNP
jgi:hypothetical protein